MKKLLILFFTLTTFQSLSQTPIEQFDDGIFVGDTSLNKFIIRWLGKPYKLGGRTEKGIDCSQFNKRLYLDVYKKELKDVCWRQWEQTQRVKKDSLEVGDLVFFRSKQSPSGWHCGCYIGNSYFVHAANRFEGVKVSSLKEPRYFRSYRGGGRLY